MKIPLCLLGAILAPALTCFGTAGAAHAETECGTAAYYDQGTITADGETFDPRKLAAAHPWIPLGTWVTVVDQDTGLSVEVKINDRGPWTDGRILDMTPAAINAIDPHQTSDLRHVCIHW